MSTNYNIKLDIRENQRAPQYLFNASVQKFNEVGLIGEKHVNHFGRVFDVYDSSCDVYKKGYFDIFYRDGGLTAREMIEKRKLEVSGFNDLAMAAVQLGESIVDSLEEIDPLAQLPFDMYSQFPGIESMEINTPCGMQSTHVHLKKGGIIRFWKPKKDKFWYDFDTVKNYLSDLVISVSLNPTFRELIQYEKALKIWSKLLENPDSVTKIRIN